MSTFTTLFGQSTGDAAGAGAAVGLALMFMFFWMLIMILVIAGLVFWVMSLIHVLQHDDVKDRTMWILIILLAGTIGGVIYFFTVKKQYDKGGARELPTVA